MIEYKIENNLSVEEFRDVLIRSTLGERRYRPMVPTEPGV